jgi:pimeloyl-ACP methyl ester carboxylesterase
LKHFINKKTIKYFFVLLLIVCLMIGGLAYKRIYYPDLKKQKIGSIELAYYTRGKGQPLFLIQGFAGRIANWDPALLEALEKKYTLILFDHRGIGQSSDTAEDQTTISQMAEDVFLLIKALGYTKVHVLGWSMGSRIALDLALAHPDVLSTLTLCSPNPGGYHQAPLKSQAYLKLLSPKLTANEALTIIYPQTAAGKKASVDYTRRIKWGLITGSVPYDFKISRQTIQRQIRALQLWNEDNEKFAQLLTIRIPTLVTAGLEDNLDQPENARIVANQIPLAWSAYFARSGHAFLFQDYDLFSSLMINFTESQNLEAF